MRNEQIYVRQDQLPLFNIGEAIVVGVGGTGTWVGIFLALSGCQRLHLMDSDVLETSNLNRLPYSPEQVTRPKTEVLKDMLINLRPEIDVNTYPNADSFTLQMVKGQVLFDCTDRAATQRTLQAHANTVGMRYIRCSYNGTHMTVTATNSEWITPGTPDGYDTVSSWSVPAAITAALGVAKAMYRENLEVCHDLSELYASPTREPTRRLENLFDIRDISTRHISEALTEDLFNNYSHGDTLEQVDWRDVATWMRDELIRRIENG